MKKEKDPDWLFKVEKQIAKKFGEEAVINPKSLWDDEKEKEYLEQIKKQFREQKNKKSKIEEKKGYSLRKKDINSEKNRVCSKCDQYSFSRRDDLYLNKWNVCEKCYIMYIEGREEKFKNKE